MSETCGGSGTHNKTIVLRGTLKLKQQTNADRIRGMSDEELAEFMDNGCDVIAPSENCTKAFYECKKCWLDWLKQEVPNG